MVDQFRLALRLDPSLIKSVRDTGHAAEYDPALRDDFIRHLSTLP